MSTEYYSNERYHRSSKKNTLKNPYSYSNLYNKNSPLNINNSRAVPFIYYDILQEASNMNGFTGGCGSIGYSNFPYVFAYRLFTDEVKNHMSLDKYIDLHKGIGHINLLNVQAIENVGTNIVNEMNYMIEVEVITGKEKNKNTENHENISYFGYYYGIFTVIFTKESWKISKISYKPEDFLCAPYHSWNYDGKLIVDIVYKNDLEIIQKIERIQYENSLVKIYGSGYGSQYRFDFVRLTNGYDILINEFKMENEEWIACNILNDKWLYLKLTNIIP